MHDQELFALKSGSVEFHAAKEFKTTLNVDNFGGDDFVGKFNGSVFDIVRRGQYVVEDFAQDGEQCRALWSSVEWKHSQGKLQESIVLVVAVSLGKGSHVGGTLVNWTSVLNGHNAGGEGGEKRRGGGGRWR